MISSNEKFDVDGFLEEKYFEMCDQYIEPNSLTEEEANKVYRGAFKHRQDKTKRGG